MGLLNSLIGGVIEGAVKAAFNGIVDRQHDCRPDQGALMSKEETQWMQEYEKEKFGKILERDVNGDPV